MNRNRHYDPPRSRLHALLFACLLLFSLVLSASAYDFPDRAGTTETCPGVLTITSAPAGATVYLDSGVQGTTPLNRIRVTAGRHTLRLSLTGYLDATDDFTILCDSTSTKSYTLLPVVTTTPTTPIVESVRVAAKVPSKELVPANKAADREAGTAVPARKTQQSAGTGTASPLFSGGHAFTPLVIHAGGKVYQPPLSTLSPYYSSQISNVPAVNAPSILTQNPITPPTAILEIDKKNVQELPRYFYWRQQSGETASLELPAYQPEWSFESTPSIDQKENLSYCNFRWASDTQLNMQMTALWQISRNPFPADPEHWQNQYVPGLVASGPVNEIAADVPDGFHYFRVNCARAVNHNPAEPPYYDGFLKADQQNAWQGTSAKMVVIPVINIGITTGTLHLGSAGVPCPTGIVAIPAGTMTENDLGHPNDNLTLSTGIPRVATRMETQILDRQIQTYYVRVVPMYNGIAGTPTLPVEIHLQRPRPCQACPPAGTEDIDAVFAPPTVVISEFYVNRMDPLSEDFSRTRAHYVTVSAPPNCDLSKTPQWYKENGGLLYEVNPCYQFITTMKGQVGWHYYVDPPEEHWYDEFFSLISNIWEGLKSIVNTVAKLYNDLKMFVINNVALICGGGDICKMAVGALLNAALAAMGVPPTIPNFAELQHMGASYLLSVAADEVGAGGVTDAIQETIEKAKEAYDAAKESSEAYQQASEAYQQAKEIIDSIPGGRDAVDAAVDAGIDAVNDKKDQLVNDATNEMLKQTDDATAAAGGDWYVPDPMFYAAHPAYLVLTISNPNPPGSPPTDRADVWVTDSQDLYRMKQSIPVPPLQPGQSVSVPVILEENYARFYDTSCNEQTWTDYTSAWGGDRGSCYIDNWVNGIHTTESTTFRSSVQVSRKVSGTLFTVNTFDTIRNGDVLASSGGPYIYVDPVNTYCNKAGVSPGMCPGTTRKVYFRYPANWKFSPPGTLKRDIAAAFDQQKYEYMTPYPFKCGTANDQGTMSGVC